MTYTDVLQSELNPFSPAIRDDPYPTYQALREASPISQGAPGMWFLTRFRDCETVLQDSRFGHLEPERSRTTRCSAAWVTASSR
jgi:cytochrome P450